MASSPLKIVCIGGGTGMPQLLSGLKLLARRAGGPGRVDLRSVVAIVSAFDDGGSSGRLMETYDTLPPGDLRNCLVALADEQLEPLMTRFLNHRFGDEDSSDPLAGHSVGNLLLLALAQVYDGDMRQALLNVGRILPIQSRILFPTLSAAVLCARLQDGTIVRGESNIGRRDNPSPIERIFLEPRPLHRDAQPPPREPPSFEMGSGFETPPMEGVVEALDNADVIAMGPGSLYTSVLPHLLVGELREALARNASRVVYACNIMNEPGETDGFGVRDFVAAIEHHGGFRPAAVLVNNARASDEFYKAYAKERLTVAFDRLEHKLEAAFSSAVEQFEPAPLRAVAAETHDAVLRLAEQIAEVNVKEVQVLPPTEPLDTEGTRVVPVDLMGTQQLVEHGRKKWVIRHDPIKLAQAVLNLAEEHIPPRARS